MWVGDAISPLNRSQRKTRPYGFGQRYRGRAASAARGPDLQCFLYHQAAWYRYGIAHPPLIVESHGVRFWAADNPPLAQVFVSPYPPKLRQNDEAPRALPRCSSLMTMQLPVR